MALGVPKATSGRLGGSAPSRGVSGTRSSRAAGLFVARQRSFSVGCRSSPSSSTSSSSCGRHRRGRSGHSLLFDKSRKKAAQEASKRCSSTTSSQSENNATSASRGKARSDSLDNGRSKWAVHAALEDALHDALESAKQTKLKPSSLVPRDPHGDQLEKGKKGKLPLPPPVPITKENVKVRVARNSEELKAVAALRVSIFQQFVNPKQQQQQQQKGKARTAVGPRGRGQSAKKRGGTASRNDENENVKGKEEYQRKNHALPPRAITGNPNLFQAAATRAQNRILAGHQMLSPNSAPAPVPVPVVRRVAPPNNGSTSPSELPSAVSMKLNRVVGGGQQIEIDLKEQWLRKQSGLEAARIYNLGERCICLLAVYHPKDEEEKLLLRSKEREGFSEMKPPPALVQQNSGVSGRTNNGTSGASTSTSTSSIGERLLSPFIKWHAPPVPKVPSTIHLQEVNGDGCESEEEKRIRVKQLQNKLEDEDGALIIGTLNIHFGQPFRPKPKVTPNHSSGNGNGNAKPNSVKQARGNGNHSSNGNRGILRSVENAGGQSHLSVSTKARVLNSLWRMKQQQQQQQQQQQTKQLDFFQLPSEEKALQKLNRDIKQAYIFNLCVSPVFRRQGIATMLLDRAQEIATKKGVKECFLHVDFGNDAAEKLYRENGYALEDDEEGKWRYIAGTRKRQLMRKRIP